MADLGEDILPRTAIIACDFCEAPLKHGEHSAYWREVGFSSFCYVRCDACWQQGLDADPTDREERVLAAMVTRAKRQSPAWGEAVQRLLGRAEVRNG